MDFILFLSDNQKLKSGDQRPSRNSTSRESVDKYFVGLERIFSKYDLKSKTECFVNMDDNGITQCHSPPYIFTSSDLTPSVITSERSTATSILPCRNASRCQIPPFFDFAGARMLLKGCTPGDNGNVNQSGWSGSEIFQKFLQKHIIRYAEGGSDDQKIFFLHDGHHSYISPNLIDYTNEHNICINQPHIGATSCSQWMLIAMEGFQNINVMRARSIRVIRYSVHVLPRKAYSAALFQVNLRSACRKSGIYPFDLLDISSASFLAYDTRKKLKVK